MPGNLAKLNQDIIDRLGTPIFFAVPEPSRPRADTASGMLYEIITGLYVTYHDHGDRLLESYLEFCTNESMMCVGQVNRHITNVTELRHGLCHGNIPRGSHAQAMTNALKKHFSQEPIQWPDFLGNMTEDQCRILVNNLSTKSDQLAKRLVEWADTIKADPMRLTNWQGKLIDKALNGHTKRYGPQANRTYYNMRIVKDISETYCNISLSTPPVQEFIIQMWLLQVEQDIRNRRVNDANYLSNSLYDAYDQAYGLTQESSQLSSDTLIDDMLGT